MIDPRSLLVIGGTAAGLSAASKAKRLDPSLQVTVFEKTGYISYGACGLPYFVGGLIEDPEDLVSVSAQVMREKRGIEVKTLTEVLSIDRMNKSIVARDLATGLETAYGYTFLVIATGASPIIPPIEGLRAEGVCVLRNVEDGIHMRALARQSRRACIIGGGFIGLELAEELTQVGLKVTLVEALDRLLPFLPESFSEKVRQHLEMHGVDVFLGSTVKRLEQKDGKVSAVVDSTMRSIPTEMVVLSVGVRPASSLAQEAGLALGFRGGIVVDGQQRTGDSAIWACGDCVQMYHLVTGKPTYVPLGTTANKMGRVAGSDIGGERARFPGVLGSQVTKVFDLYIAATGLSFEEAVRNGYDVQHSSITKADKASYYPGGKQNHINLVFEKTSGRLLGAQAVGSESVAGRINVLAACITAGFTLEQVNDLDLVYAPPVAPVYDPILIAASQAMKVV
ncbi:FAD-dependent oxidoreductase [Sphaerochaeta sp. PS]|uniref:FAD-dependent oxidoreductase n=1 Tax=Sphaerochaeta sp. PS TaxID=3076336 RepID=UPI0028A34983|nr:FAD-dependent oxidoreductase [Sphaerochaeta sp. PS]MDT4762846.1 FAD-dependent oxidoreductase [Sphaerochaeta sp. PS]